MSDGKELASGASKRMTGASGTRSKWRPAVRDINLPLLKNLPTGQSGALQSGPCRERREGACERSEQADDRSERHPLKVAPGCPGH